MQFIRKRDGSGQLKLTKSERKQLSEAFLLCFDIAKHASDGATQDAAEKVRDGLDVLLDRIDAMAYEKLPLLDGVPA